MPSALPQLCREVSQEHLGHTHLGEPCCLHYPWLPAGYRAFWLWLPQVNCG